MNIARTIEQDIDRPGFGRNRFDGASTADIEYPNIYGRLFFLKRFESHFIDVRGPNLRSFMREA
jgi:hypothetical protein